MTLRFTLGCAPFFVNFHQRSLLRTCREQSIGDMHEFCDRVHAHLLHYMGAVRFYGPLRSAQFGCNLLV